MDVEPERRSTARHLTNVFFGVVAPLACLIFDPIVFQGLGGGGFLQDYLIVGYLASLLGFASMLSWTFLRVLPAFHSGTLLGAGIFAACLGIVLFPISFMCLIILIGIFGFTPLFTAWVFFREARVAALTVSRSPATIASLAAGIFISCGVPWAAQLCFNREVNLAMNQAIEKNPALEATEARLRLVAKILPDSQFDCYVLKRANEADSSKQVALADSYHRITGREIG